MIMQVNHWDCMEGSQDRRREFSGREDSGRELIGREFSVRDREVRERELRHGSDVNHFGTA